jgi:NAD+ kinase
MMRIGLVIHGGRDASVNAAADASRILRAAGVDVVVAPAADPTDDRPIDLHRIGDTRELDGFADGLDLVISFGGDGTFLRAAHLCRDDDVPVLGVNLGRLGFLAEVEVEALEEAMAAVSAGTLRYEERATLDVVITPSDGTPQVESWALNEVSIEKSARQRLLLMEVHLDGALFARVPADALVLATSTGSTAYALSAGGPIVSPKLDATLVVPVAPHTLFDRTIVAAPDEEVRVELRDEQAPAIVSCDGREPVEVPAGSSVTARGGGRPVVLARVDPLDLATVVRRKFGLQ